MTRLNTAPQRLVLRTFVVNVRTPKIATGGEVKLKDRETTTEAWAWDEKLTLEFNNARPCLCALEIERGRGVQAATREGLITESLQQLQQGLEEAASMAGNEAGEKRNGARKANPDDLLAELTEHRWDRQPAKWSN